MTSTSRRAALIVMTALSAASLSVQGMGPDPGGKSGEGVTPETTVVDHPAVNDRPPSGAADSTAGSGQVREDSAARKNGAADRSDEPTENQDARRR